MKDEIIDMEERNQKLSEKKAGLLEYKVDLHFLQV